MSARDGRTPPVTDGAAPTRPVVLMIVGHGRSGSSLVERMLGGSNGFTNIGEAHVVFRSGVSLGLTCRCGRPFVECTTWQQIGRDALGGWHADTADRMHHYFTGRLRYRQLPGVARRFRSGRADADDRRYADTFTAVYRSIADAADHDVLVDSSKHLGHAVAMGWLADIDLRVLHLVRDPRGNAYSWQKRGVGLGAMGLADRSMPVFSPARTALDWTTRNLLTERLLPPSVPRVRIRYEDFAAQPIAVLERALTDLGIARSPTWQHVDGCTVSFPADHALGGNPGVIASRSAEVRLDDEWHSRLGRRETAVVTAIAAPLMRAYGYRLRVSRRR